MSHLTIIHEPRIRAEKIWKKKLKSSHPSGGWVRKEEREIRSKRRWKVTGGTYFWMTGYSVIERTHSGIVGKAFGIWLFRRVLLLRNLRRTSFWGACIFISKVLVIFDVIFFIFVPLPLGAPPLYRGEWSPPPSELIVDSPDPHPNTPTPVLVFNHIYGSFPQTKQKCYNQ